MKMEAQNANADVENKYKYLYEPEYSPERLQKKNGHYSGNRQSLNVHKLGERAVESYDMNYHKPSQAALQQYRLHDRQQLSSAAIGYHSRAQSNLCNGGQQQRAGVISAAGLRDLRNII